jgi:central glycolytic genes regulator
MREIIRMQQQLAPDLIDVIRRRHMILHHLRLLGTAGRRTLASSLAISERVLRAETDFLREQGLLKIDARGMIITEAGRELLQAMEPLVSIWFGLSEMEDELRRRFNLQAVTVVPGDSDVSPAAKKELGRAGSTALIRFASPNNDIIAVTGGSTMAEIANWLNPAAPFKGVCFVPARGGLGESVEFQANTIASTMAKNTGAAYRLLHVPDHLGEEAYQTLMQEPNIREVVSVVRKARIVVHGIGDAVRMARRRNMDERSIAALVKDGALAEAFGYYFNRDGQVVHKMPTVGLRLEDIQHTETVIAVAGGASKGKAIAAVLRFGHEDVLITDEAAAKEILADSGQ